MEGFHRLNNTALYALLHKKYWGTDTSDVFSVSKGATASYLEFKGFDPSSHSAQPVLVRHEYDCALKTISEFAKRPTRILTKYYETEDSPEQDSFPLNLTPFNKGDPGVYDERPAGVSVLGIPGSGKSLFLQFVLVMRLASCRTTLLVDETENIFLFHNDGVFQVTNPRLARGVIPSVIPPSAWVLVDSGVVDAQIMHLDLFVVQAVTPHPQSLGWTSRTSRATAKYYMKPLTLTETLSINELRVGGTSLSPQDVAQRYEVFGPFPRDIFSGSIPVTSFPAVLEAIVNELYQHGTLEDAKNRAKLGDYSYGAEKLFVVSPGPRRDAPKITLATKGAFRALFSNYRAPNISYFVKSLHVPPSYVLETVIHRKFKKGGQFPLHRLAPWTATLTASHAPFAPISWRFEIPTIGSHPQAYLWVGNERHGQGMIDISPRGSTSSPPSPTSGKPASPFSPKAENSPPTSLFGAVPMARSISWPSSDSTATGPVPVHTQVLDTGFVIPSDSYSRPYSVVGIDMDTKSAVVFEAFAATKDGEYNISTDSFAWLSGRGVVKISYVAVLLGARPKWPVHLSIAEDWSTFAVDKYISLHDSYGEPMV